MLHKGWAKIITYQFHAQQEFSIYRVSYLSVAVAPILLKNGTFFYSIGVCRILHLENNFDYTECRVSIKVPEKILFLY